MSLNVSGLVVIVEEPTFKETKNGGYFTCKVLSPNAIKDGPKSHHRASIYVSDKKITEAKDKITKGRLLMIRNGEWQAEEKEWQGKQTTFNTLSLSYNNLMFLDFLAGNND